MVDNFSLDSDVVANKIILKSLQTLANNVSDEEGSNASYFQPSAFKYPSFMTLKTDLPNIAKMG